MWRYEYKGKFWALGDRLYGTSVLFAKFSINLTALKNKVLHSDTCALSKMQTFFLNSMGIPFSYNFWEEGVILHSYNIIQKSFQQHIDMSSPKINIFIITGLFTSVPTPVKHNLILLFILGYRQQQLSWEQVMIMIKTSQRYSFSEKPNGSILSEKEMSKRIRQWYL